ncbi:hypothetical protein GCM10011348_16690 [Marinobacterium nitratireducens]|uniref:Uncharacterized protein n=1 Tax=Marinobacterium nitratireducens TaxID=518897 RepID=A0A917ZCH3_9GAMM|nr:hypothetical protein [Marinobacterium nitratireducens]GGO80318.1 hypothetical protein GCM10011348_16690 [Marinobacterium nitratireducens]
MYTTQAICEDMIAEEDTMDFNYLPFDFATRTNPNRRETEREYFMRLLREQQAERALARRQERTRKIKSFVSKTFVMKRTETLETLFSR